MSDSPNKEVEKEFLEFLVRSLVDHPDDVKIDRIVDDNGVFLTLRVHPNDMGQVIGRKGATANAIRPLLKIVGVKNNIRVSLKIEEPEGGRVSETEQGTPETGETAE